MGSGVYAWCKYVMSWSSDWQAPPIGEGKRRKRPWPRGSGWPRVEVILRNGEFLVTLKKKEVCFRLKGEIPPKHPYFKLSRMCSFQALQVHLQSQSFSSFSSWLHFSRQLWVYWLLGFGMLLPTPRKLVEMKASDLIQRKVPGYLVPLCPP